MSTPESPSQPEPRTPASDSGACGCPVLSEPDSVSRPAASLSCDCSSLSLSLSLSRSSPKLPGPCSGFKDRPPARQT
eukprot:1224763-Rhodomonas_salina.2